MRIVLGLTRLTPSVCPHAVPMAHRSRPARGKDQSSALLRAKEWGHLDRLSIVYATGQPQSASRLRTLSSSPEIVDQDPGLPGRWLFRYDAPERAPLARTDDAPWPDGIRA